MLYQIEKIDKRNERDDYWQRIYEFSKKCSEIRGVDFKEESLNRFKSSYLLWLNNGGMSYLVLKNAKEAGHFGFDVYHKEDLDKRQVVFYNRLIDRFLDESLMRIILQCFLVYDLKSKYFYIKSENGKSDFIPLKLGVKAYDNRGLYELIISELNIEELLKKLNAYRDQYSDYSLQFYETLPDSLLESYCNTFVSLIKEVPGNPDAESYKLEASELKEQQESLTKNAVYELRYLLYDNDTLIGLTSVGLKKNESETGYQHLTGISKDYRGIGLGKYIKLAMLFKLKETYPDFRKLETEIHQKNRISIEMNESMGYKLKGERKVYFIPRKRIEDWLGEN